MIEVGEAERFMVGLEIEVETPIGTDFVAVEPSAAVQVTENVAGAVRAPEETDPEVPVFQADPLSVTEQDEAL